MPICQQRFGSPVDAWSVVERHFDSKQRRDPTQLAEQPARVFDMFKDMREYYNITSVISQRQVIAIEADDTGELRLQPLLDHRSAAR